MKSSKNWLIIVIVIAVLLCAVASYVNRPLPAYIDTPSQSQTETPEIDLPELATYEDDHVLFEYPQAWRKTVKSGNTTFLNTDGTYLMFQQTSYQPQINSVTDASLQNELAAAGKQPLYFERLTTSSFLLSYQTDRIVSWEYVTWDLEHECRLIFAYNEDETEKYQNLIPAIFGSFQWEQQAPIPNSLYLVYNAFGNFEFAVPAGWTSGVSSEAFCATNMETGSVFCVTVSETDLTTLRETSQIQYAQAAQSRSNLYIKNYGAADKQITAESLYTLQGSQMLFYHVMALQDGYLYEFMLDAPISIGEADYNTFLDCMPYFRTF